MADPQLQDQNWIEGNSIILQSAHYNITIRVIARVPIKPDAAAMVAAPEFVSVELG
jgi:hypothetical protein